MSKKQVIIYTDGGCSGNPGAGAYAAILTYTSPSGQYFEKSMTGGYKLTTNNRMELMAAIAALGALKEESDVILYSDSKYLVDAIEQKWLDNWIKKNWKIGTKSPVKNIDLWKKLISLLKKHNVKFCWVKGHAGHDFNERCDALVKQTFVQANLPDDVEFVKSSDNVQQKLV